MILQNPSVLWGLFLLAIPIIVHLFDFRRIKRIQFSNVAFLQNIQKQNTPRRRLKDLLILFARLLALAFMILAFASPIIPNENSIFSTSDNLLVIDNSRSMATKCQSVACLEAARIASLEIANSYGTGRFYYQSAHRIKRFISSDEFAQQLNQMPFSRSKFDLKFEENELARSQVTVLSDFQAGVIKEVERLAADSIPMLLVPMNQSVSQNLYVDSVFLKNPFSIGDNKRVLGVKIINSGIVETESTLVRIYNNLNQLSSVVVTIGANASETVFFQIENSLDPIYRVSVEDYEVDFDNDYYFTLPSFEPIKITVLGGKKSRAIEAIFENKNYFDLEVYSSSSIDFERFFSSDLVIVHSLDQLPQWLDTDRMSGDLVVIPSASLDTNNYSNRLGFSISKSRDSTFSELNTSSFEHPFFNSMFDDLNTRASFPKVRNIHKIAGANDVLLRSDAPYLQRLDRTNKIYWFNGPLEDGFSELQNHALFLPIMYRIAEESKGFNETLNYTLTDSPLQVNLERASTELLELNGDNSQFVPSFYFNQSTLILNLPPELNEPGFYYLMAGADTLKVLALNIDRKESVLNGMNTEELRQHFQSSDYVQVLKSDSPAALSATLSELTTGKELWKYALLLALLFLLTETALHRWLK